MTDRYPGPSATDSDSDARFRRAIAAIDTANAEDPNSVVIDGVEQPKERAHAELMTQWVYDLDPHAGAEQLVAARAHHLRRWEMPRDGYPEGRAGYLRWRTDQRRRHTQQVAALLIDVGYDRPFIERVQQIIGKVDLRNDPAVQTHEDALCLVFLRTQLDQLASRLGDSHVEQVVRKSAAKMSDRGVAAAAGLPLSDHGRLLLQRALADP